jgi:hypothetical protein
MLSSLSPQSYAKKSTRASFCATNFLRSAKRQPVVDAGELKQCFDVYFQCVTDVIKPTQRRFGMAVHHLVNRLFRDADATGQFSFTYVFLPNSLRSFKRNISTFLFICLFILNGL